MYRGAAARATLAVITIDGWLHLAGDLLMITGKLYLVAAFAALCLVGAKAHAQVVRPTAVSRSAPDTDRGSTSRNVLAIRPLLATHSTEVTSSRGLRARPMVIGVVVGALAGAGAGQLLGAGACEGFHCSTRHEVITSAWLGAVVGGLFGLVLALPPKDQRE